VLKAAPHKAFIFTSSEILKLDENVSSKQKCEILSTIALQHSSLIWFLSFFSSDEGIMHVKCATAKKGEWSKYKSTDWFPATNDSTEGSTMKRK
jgi:hypothetical protein